MDSRLKVFKHNQFGNIRTMTIENNPFFVGVDVAKSLGYSNASKAIIDHVDPEDKTMKMIAHSQNGNVVKTQTTIINESGLYTLILSSKLPDAKKFKRWVTSEVLPAIRKTGGYIKVEETDDDSEILAKAFLIAQRTIEQKNSQIKEMKPKALFADAVSTSDTTILIGELAKILKGNGFEIGQNRLFERLRNDGFLIRRKGTDWNSPTQRAMDLGLFRIKETAITHSDGRVSISKTTKVTGKGQKYFVNYFLGKVAVN